MCGRMPIHLIQNYEQTKPKRHPVGMTFNTKGAPTQSSTKALPVGYPQTLSSPWEMARR